MEDLFRSYWWLLFPLAWFIGSGWTSWLNYRRQRETLDIVRRYADSGKEIPPELMKVLDRPSDPDAELLASTSYGSATPTNYWSLFGLFAVILGLSVATNATVMLVAGAPLTDEARLLVPALVLLGLGGWLWWKSRA